MPINNPSSGGDQVEATLVPPVAADFTQQNAGTATFVDSSLGLVHTCPNAVSQIRFLRWTAAALPATFIATMRAKPLGLRYTGCYPCSFVARNSANNRIMISGQYQDGQYLAQNWSSYTTFAGGVFALSPADLSNPWFQFEKTATDMIVRNSSNGVNWNTLFSVTIASYLGGLDEFGIGTMVNGVDTGTIFQSFDLV